MRIPIYLPTEPYGQGPNVPANTTEPLFMGLPFYGTHQDDELTPEDFTLYPLKIEIEKCIEWWWRVKEWTVTVTASSAIATMPERSFIIKAETGAVYLNIKEQTAFMDSNENHMEFGNPLTHYEFVAGTEEPNQTAQFDGGDIQLGCTFRHMQRGGPPPYEQYEDSPYYKLHNFTDATSFIMPLIAVVIPVLYEISPTQIFWSSLETFERPLGSTEVIDCTGDFTIGGESFFGYAYRDTDNGGEALTSFAVTIEPTKWWPYDIDGQFPIWDESTGVQLRDTVTGVLL